MYPHMQTTGTHRHFSCPSDPQNCRNPSRCTFSGCCAWCSPNHLSAAVRTRNVFFFKKRGEKGLGWVEYHLQSVLSRKNNKTNNKQTKKTTKNLRLMLICAFRAPRIWTGRTEVSSGGTESPAKNLPSFFKSRHLHCNVRTFFFFQTMTENHFLTL